MSEDTNIPTPEQFGLSEVGGIAYVTAIRVSDLDPEIQTPAGIETVYALHDQAGRRLALFDDRNMAFAVAKSNDLTPMSAH